VRASPVPFGRPHSPASTRLAATGSGSAAESSAGAAGGLQNLDQEGARAALQHHFGCSAAGDEDRAHEIYLGDAVLEFPQSGERFEGVPNFREWRRNYPADVDLEIRRVRGGGDVFTMEVAVRHDGGPWNFGVSIHECGDKIRPRDDLLRGALRGTGVASPVASRASPLIALTDRQPPPKETRQRRPRAHRGMTVRRSKVGCAAAVSDFLSPVGRILPDFGADDRSGTVGTSALDRARHD
jgi:hypothetical protein